MKTRVGVLLLAGVGSRLRPLTDDRPKALVEIAGTSLLARAVRTLVDYGVTRFVCASGYREEALRRALTALGVDFELVHNPRYDATQNSVSLALCRRAIRGEAFFKLDGDVLFRSEVLARLDASDAPLAVAVDRGRRLDAEAMKVELAPDGSVAAFGKSIPLAHSAGESIGIERVAAELGPALFDALDRVENAQRYYEDVYGDLIATQRLHAACVDVSDLPWTEIDDHDDLRAATELVGRGAFA